MKILVLTIAVFTLNVYVTSATSLDPTQYVEMKEAKSESDDVRTKRSGDIFSSLLNKKFGLISSITGSSSGKSIGHSEHYEEPLSYNTKSFNLWGVKKAIMGSVLQAAKAITGGVIALKGQLIKAKGHVVVAKGKLMQTKGEAISNFGKTIATHAFDSHEEPHVEVYSHVTPIHQPTSYGAATALGYQAQSYPSNGFQSHGAYPSHGFPLHSYPVAAHSFPTSFAVPSTVYGGTGAGTGIGTGYGMYGGGNGFPAKRAVQQDSSKVISQNTKNLVDKDSVQAGLLIFKPIKMGQNQPIGGGGSGLTSQSADSVLQNFNQHHFNLQNGNAFDGSTDFKGSATGFPSAFPGFQGGAFNNAYPKQQQLQTGGGYPSFPVPATGYSLNSGYPGAAQAAYQFPTGGGGGDSFEKFPGAAAGQAAYGLQNFAFPQPTDSHEFDRQLAAFSGHTSYSSQEASATNSADNSGYGNGGGSDQRDSASDSEEHAVVARPTQKAARHVQHTKVAVDHFLPTTTRYSGDDDDDGRAPASDRTGTTNKRSTSKKDDAAAASSVQASAGIVPLKYQHDGSNSEDQARLKKTVQRFFSMLHKQPCELHTLV